MFRTITFALVLGWLAAGMELAVPAAQAAEPAQSQTVTLNVKNMTCAMCPITVRKALEKVPGVIEAEAKYEGKGVGWAEVTFDPSKTTSEALSQATADAGYPSHVQQE